MKKSSLKIIALENIGFSLITLTSFQQDELFLDFKFNKNTLLNSPSYKSIEISKNQHLEDVFLSYINHSCEPNVKIDTSSMVCSALRDINAGESLSFFYPSTEWAMIRPFLCQCQAPHCLGEIRGAQFLSMDTLSKYYINQHIINRKLLR